jgi:hypothetical protein
VLGRERQGEESAVIPHRPDDAVRLRLVGPGQQPVGPRFIALAVRRPVEEVLSEEADVLWREALALQVVHDAAHAMSPAALVEGRRLHEDGRQRGGPHLALKARLDVVVGEISLSTADAVDASRGEGEQLTCAEDALDALPAPRREVQGDGVGGRLDEGLVEVGVVAGRREVEPTRPGRRGPVHQAVLKVGDARRVVRRGVPVQRVEVGEPVARDERILAHARRPRVVRLPAPVVERDAREHLGVGDVKGADQPENVTHPPEQQEADHLVAGRDGEGLELDRHPPIRPDVKEVIRG